MDTTPHTYDNANFWNIPASNYDSRDALAYLNDPKNFPPFSWGLTRLLESHGYQGTSGDAAQKTEFLYGKMSSIDSKVAKGTIKGWFEDKHRPALVSNSRLLMRQICFALSLTLEEAAQFFHDTYYDRFFNCHTINEAVSYYCLRNRLPYSHAQELIGQIEAFPLTEEAPSAKSQLPLNSAPVFTRDIQKRLDICSSDEMLLSFFRAEKHIFTAWNTSALHAIRRLLSNIQGNDRDKSLILAMRNGSPYSPRQARHCSLIIQEFLHDKGSSFLMDMDYKHVASVDFMLDCILHAFCGMNKHSAAPIHVRTNFPSKKTFSKTLSKIETTTSYDSIRKCLVLLKFYDFWCRGKLEQDEEAYSFDNYTAETNHLLWECGYESLFQDNPYDFLFLWASTTKDPLGYLRDAVERAIYHQEASE